MTGRTTGFIARAAAAALAVSLAACGGQSGPSSALPSTTGGTQTPVSTSKSATAHMVVTIPAALSSGAKRPAYISSSTKSMTVGLQSGSTTTQLAEVDLTPASPNCTTLSGGGTQCTVSIVASPGNQTFVLKMYDQTGAKGNLLSTGDAAATLVSGQNTNVPLTLDGVPAGVSLVLGTGTLPVGYAGSTSVIVQAKDADGNIIVGPGSLTTPVTLAIAGDTYKTLSLSASSVTQPGQVVTLNYTGGTNVGSTITPSLGSTVGTPATFAGTGTAITQIATALTGPSGYRSSLRPTDVAALPGGKAGVLFETSSSVCCTTLYAWAIGIASTAGYQNYYVGDTTDPFNPSTATSPFVGETGVTVVKGMSLNLAGLTYGQAHALVSDGNGNLYYGASFSSTAANDGCSGGTLSSGVIGIFNPATATTKESILKGVPQYMQIDDNGNVWFVEKSGTCNGTSLLASGWGIGELKAGSTTPLETDFAAAGIAAGANPVAMNITPDGSSMFIANTNDHTIVKVATAAMTSATVTPVHSTDITGLAAGPDGTLYFMSSDQNNSGGYYYGYIEGSQPFATANVHEALFPVPDFYGNDAVYADGSYWASGYSNNGLGRLSGLETGSPQIQFYSTMTPYYAEPYSLAAGSGYIWATDDDYDSLLALQYGTQSTATTTLGLRKTMQSRASVTTTINSWRRIGTFSAAPLSSRKQ